MRPGDGLERELGPPAARAAGLMLAPETVESLVRLLTATAVQVVPAATGAGLTLVDDRGRRASSAGTSDWVLWADRLQYELDEGPCLTAARERRPVSVLDTDGDQRWPRWAAAVRDRVRSCLSVPLVVGGRGLGALKLYGYRPEAFTEADVGTLTMFAGQAALLVSHRQDRDRAGRLSEEVRTTLQRRDRVARACGVLMGRDGLSADAAFTHLLSLSDSRRRPVHDVAADLLDDYEDQA